MASPTERPPAESLLTTPAALAKRVFETTNVRILDATWFMPTPGTARPRDPEDEFRRGPRIKGAAGFWDVDQIAGHNKLGLSHMLPTPETFAKACCAN
jgi:thiosulfate/3-mercaptopyruvate sulfurtransferase